MNPKKTESTTRELGKPIDWDDSKGPCQTLPITDSGGVMYSYWATTWRERLAILLGTPIRLAIVGNQHPPVMIEASHDH